MFHRLIFYIVFLFVFMIHGLSQDYSKIVDYLDEDNISVDELEDIIDEYRNNPIVLSDTRREDILNLPINVDLKYKLLMNIEKLGDISKWGELTSTVGLSEDEVNFLRLFFVIKKKDQNRYSVINYISMGKNNTCKYQLDKIKQQIVYRSRFISTAFSNESDQGEENLFDSYKFSICLNMLKNRYEFIAGPYRIKWGMGILFSSSLFSGFVRDAYNNIYVSKVSIKPYTGYSEYHFLNGVALKRNFQSGKILLFYSKCGLDAKVINDTVTKFINSGYHVSQSEINSKNAVFESIHGIGLTQNSGAGKYGIIFGKILYDKVVGFLYNNHNINFTSVFHRLTFNQVEYIGEVVSLDRFISLIEGLKIDVNNYKVSIGYRRMNPYIFSRLGRSRKYYPSYNVNEEGFLFSITGKFKNFSISYFNDFHRRFINDDNVWERMGRLYFYLKIRRQTNIGLDIYRDNPLSDDENLKLRLNINYKIARHFLFKNRIIMKFFTHKLRSTLTMLTLKYENENWRIYTGFSEYYNEEGAISSIFEPSVSYNIDLVNLYGNGRRFFIVFKGIVKYNFEFNVAYKRNIRVGKEYDRKEKTSVVFQTCYHFRDKY